MLTATEIVIKRFRDYVIQQSRSNLTKGGKNVTKELYNSLKGEIVQEKNYFIVGFQMDDYGMFQDQGVKGKTSSSKAPNSPFKFGKSWGTKSGELKHAIEKWVKIKNIQFREKEGKGVKGQFLSHKQTSYLITRSVYHKGIKPSLFFTKPFEAGYKKFIDTDLIKAFGADIETMIDYNLKDIK